MEFLEDWHFWAFVALSFPIVFVLYAIIDYIIEWKE